MRTMNIGKLNKRIDILHLADVEDEIGQTVQKLEKVKTVWATLAPVRGQEFYEIQKVEGKTTHKCYMRFMEDITSNDFIKYKDLVLSIESVLDVDLDGKMLEIMCTSHLNSEIIKLLESEGL